MKSNSKDSKPTYQTALLQTIAYRNIRAAVNGVLAKYTLNTTQWIIIGLVNDNPGNLRIKDVASSIAVEGPLVTKLVNELVAAEYVQSSAQAGDNRAKILELTAAGKKLYSKVEHELVSKLDSVRAGLSRNDLETYFRILEVFINNTTPLPTRFNP